MRTICGIFLLIVAASAAPVVEPIRLHPANPHYFLFRGKPTVLVSSGEHYGAVINRDFDYKRYLKTLAADHLNLTRTFTGAYREGPESFGIKDNTLAPAHDRFLAPWPRTDVPGALDGLTKFDLTRWSPEYFARLKDFVREAGAQGIVVELTMFCPYYRDEMWNLSPLNAGNNVNGIGNFKREEVFTLKDPAMQKVQDALVRKIVDELREFDNVMYEICNEPYSFNLVTAEWERHIAYLIEGAESKRPHLITQNISNGSKKIASPNPNVAVFNFHYSRPPLSVALNRDLERPIGCNETGFDGQVDAVYRVQGWEFLMAGGALFNNLDYSFTVGHEDGTYSYPAGQPGGGSVTLRKQLGNLRDFMGALDVVSMIPVKDFVQSGVPSGGSIWVLVAPRKMYALYLHHGNAQKDQRVKYAVDTTPHTAQLGVDLPKGKYQLEWVDPKTGLVMKQDSFAHKGGRFTLESPEYAEDIALRMRVR